LKGYTHVQGTEAHDVQGQAVRCGSVQLGEDQTKGNLIATHSSLMSIYICGRARLFSEVYTKRTQEHGKFLLDLRGGRMDG